MFKHSITTHGHVEFWLLVFLEDFAAIVILRVTYSNSASLGDASFPPALFYFFQYF